MSDACRSCGALTDGSVEFSGKIEATLAMCDGCSARAFAELDVLRAQFDSLIAAGVDRHTANQIMIQRIEANPS